MAELVVSDASKGEDTGLAARLAWSLLIWETAW